MILAEINPSAYAALMPGETLSLMDRRPGPVLQYARNYLLLRLPVPAGLFPAFEMRDIGNVIRGESR